MDTNIGITINKSSPAGPGALSTALGVGPASSFPSQVSYQQNGPCLSANVQSISPSLNFNLFGWNPGPSFETCGQIISKVVCKEHEDHKPYFKHEYCNDPLCPTCFEKFTSRLSEGIVDRILGYKQVYPSARFDHVVIWPIFGTEYKTTKEAYRAGVLLAKNLGVVAGAIIFHPYRIQEDIKKELRKYRNEKGLPSSVGFWRMARDDVLGLGSLAAYVVPGVHFHVLSQGYLPNYTEYANLKQGGYKKVRRLDTEADISRVTHYLTSHTVYSPGSHAVRYFGKMSYANLGRYLESEKVEDIVCSVCGASLQEYWWNDSFNGTGTVKREKLTALVKTYRYFDRNKKPKALAKLGAYQSMICI